MSERHQTFLQVSFAGSLVGCTDYTTQGDEVKRGVLRRIDGGEEQKIDGIYLGGATEGIIFESSIEAGRELAIEVEFTVTEWTDLATIVAAPSSLIVRAHQGMMLYGFSATAENLEKTPLTLGHHVLSLRCSDSVLTGTLDGELLQPVTATELGTKQAQFVFGNDLDFQHGLKGALQALRIAEPGPDARELIESDATTNSKQHERFSFSPGQFVPVAAEDSAALILAKAAAVRPTPHQVTWQELRYTGFIHFGPNTFEGVEWGGGTFPPELFTPTHLDVDSWVRHLREAGMRMAILTVKHHDGFLLYPSRYGTYSVRYSPRKPDILQEFTAACAKYGMRVGVYLSPADSHAERAGIFANGSAATRRTIPTLTSSDDRAAAVESGELPTLQYLATDYGQYFLNQLYEVLTEYGPIDEVWFDGASGNTEGTENFDYGAYYDLIKRLQPQALIAVGGRDIRWIGNELGQARENEWSVVPVQEPQPGGKISLVTNRPFDQQLGSDAKLVAAVQQLGATHLCWWPGEADMKLTEGWFWAPDRTTPLSAETLLWHWEATVGRNAVMLLNVPPTAEGRLPTQAVTALQEFAQLRRRAFGCDLALGHPVEVGVEKTLALTDGNPRTSWSAESEETTFVIDISKPSRVERIGVGEDISRFGQQIRKIQVFAELDGRWEIIAGAGSVGLMRLWKLEQAVTAQRFKIEVASARGPYGIATWSLFQELEQDPGVPTAIWLDSSVKHAGIGTKDRPMTSLQQLGGIELAPSATLYIKAGTQYQDADVRLWSYGTTEHPITIVTYGDGASPTIGGISALEWFQRRHPRQPFVAKRG